ncbi:hypothetical protein DFH06DRAFT_1308684 [Mycena polygramma]|nr:hypothetical protein DFH06DRAFT_1308684 [Mycena polygramma]
MPDANFHPGDCSAVAIDSFSPPRLRAQLEYITSAIVQQKLEHKKRIDALEKKQHELEMELARIVYPVLTLPPEIVCRQWREIAISSSELWTCVRLGISADSQEANDAELAVLQTWFARAEKRPLSVTLYSKTSIPNPILFGLIAVGEQLNSLSLPISWEDFRNLRCDGIEFPNLLRLELEIIHDPLVTETPIDRAPLTPLLQCLTLHQLNLACFTLPTLRMLALDFEDHDEVELVPSFITRSSCVLEHLSLPSHIDQAKFVACLQAAPSLTSLTVELDSLDTFARTMSTEPPLLPLLRNLSIYLDPTGADMNYPSLILFLHRRLSHPVRLNSVTLKIRSLYEDAARMGDAEWFPRSAKAAFEPLIAQGLIVEVFCEGNYYWPEKSVDEVYLSHKAVFLLGLGDECSPFSKLIQRAESHRSLS